MKLADESDFYRWLTDQDVRLFASLYDIYHNQPQNHEIINIGATYAPKSITEIEIADFRKNINRVKSFGKL